MKLAIENDDPRIVIDEVDRRHHMAPMRREIVRVDGLIWYRIVIMGDNKPDDFGPWFRMVSLGMDDWHTTDGLVRNEIPRETVAKLDRRDLELAHGKRFGSTALQDGAL